MRIAQGKRGTSAAWKEPQKANASTTISIAGIIKLNRP
jgi:hypothetical protein